MNDSPYVFVLLINCMNSILDHKPKKILVPKICADWFDFHLHSFHWTKLLLWEALYLRTPQNCWLMGGLGGLQTPAAMTTPGTSSVASSEEITFSLSHVWFYPWCCHVRQKFHHGHRCRSPHYHGPCLSFWLCQGQSDIKLVHRVPTVTESHGKICGHGKSWQRAKI